MPKSKKRMTMIPAWWKTKPTPKQKQMYMDSLVQYIREKDLRKKLPKQGIETCKSMIEVMKEHRGWQDMTPDALNTTKWDGHIGFYDTVVNLLRNEKKLKLMIEDADREAEQEEYINLEGSDDLDEPNMPEQEAKNISFPTSCEKQDIVLLVNENLGQVAKQIIDVEKIQPLQPLAKED